MEKRTRLYFILSGGLFALFLLTVILLLTVDVRAVGPENSSVGLSTLNLFFAERIGENPTWYRVTDWLGYLMFPIAAFFAVLGFIQLIKRKSLKRVDADILVLAVFYVVVVLFYVLFELCIVNYRPVLADGSLEASFPSSHTMLMLCIVGSAVIQLTKRLRHKPLKITLTLAATALATLTVVGRLLSGVHWFTDILGGILLSAALILLYQAVITALNKPKETKETEENQTN